MPSVKVWEDGAEIEVWEPDRPTLGERFKTDAKMMASGSVLGAIYRSGGSMLPPGLDMGAGAIARSFGVPSNPAEQKQLEEEYAAMPGAEGFAERATAVAGHIGGSLIPSPENYTPVGRGATALQTFAKGARGVGFTNLLTDTAVQAADVSTGVQDEFSFKRLLVTGGASSLIGGLANAAPDVLFRTQRQALKVAAAPDTTPELKAQALTLAQEIDKKLGVGAEVRSAEDAAKFILPMEQSVSPAEASARVFNEALGPVPEPKGPKNIDDYLVDSEIKGLRGALDEGQIGGPDTASAATQMSDEAANRLSLRTQIEALDKRKALDTLNSDPAEVLPLLSPQARRMYEQYGRISPQVMATMAGGGVGAVAGSTQGDTIEERLANAGYGFLFGIGVGYGVGRGMSRKPMPFNPDSPPGALKPQVDPKVDPPARTLVNPKERKLMGNAIESAQTKPEVAAKLTNAPERYYEPEGWNEAYGNARKRIQKAGSLDNAFGEYRQIKNPTADDQAMALDLYRAYQQAGEYDKAFEVMTLLSKRATSQGQAIAILRTLSRSTPEGLIAFAEKTSERVAKPAERAEMIGLQKAAQDALDKAAAAAAKGDYVLEDQFKDLALAQAARMYDAAARLTPSSAVDKATAALNISLLLNPKTQIRNIAGNAVLTTVHGLADAISPALDRAIGIFTGKRTISGYGAIKYWSDLVAQPRNDAVMSVKNADWSKIRPAWQVAKSSGFTKFGPIKDLYKSVSGPVGEATDIMAAMARATSSGKMELNAMKGVHRTVFSNRVMRGLEKTLTVLMGAPDRAFMKARFHAALRSQMRAANTKTPTQDMWARAHAEAMEAIFQDDNRASKMLRGLRHHVLNYVGFETKDGKRFGLGNIIIPFTQVPGSILKRGLQFSPLGFVRGGYRAVRGAMAGEFDQRGFAQEMAKAIVGSGLIGGAYWAAHMGLIRGGKFESYDVEATMRREGALPYSINLSAVNRMFLSGDFEIPQTTEKGDVIYTYDWAQPLALPISMGADINRYQDIKEVEQIKGKARHPAEVIFGSVFEAAASSSQTLSDQPVLTGLSAFFRNTGGPGGNPVEGVAEAIAGLPSMYLAPPLAAQVRQYMDNRVMETRHDDAFKALWNRFRDRIPGVAEAAGFKVKHDELGKPIERYPGETHNWFNVFFNPGFVRTIQADPVNREILEVWRRTGDTGAVPNPVRKKIRVNDHDRILTSQEISDYQQFVGRATRDVYYALVTNEKFRRLPVEKKARIMGRVTADANSAAKIVLFGDRPKTATKGAQSFIKARKRFQGED